MGESKYRCAKRVIEHNSKDNKSTLLHHANKTNHTQVWLQDFKILGSNYSCDFKRKIIESIHIKHLLAWNNNGLKNDDGDGDGDDDDDDDLQPELNVQKDLYILKLFN